VSKVTITYRAVDCNLISQTAAFQYHLAKELGDGIDHLFFVFCTIENILIPVAKCGIIVWLQC